MGDGEYKEGHLAPALPRCICQSSPSNKQITKMIRDHPYSLVRQASPVVEVGGKYYTARPQMQTVVKVLLLVLESQQSDSALLVICN